MVEEGRDDGRRRGEGHGGGAEIAHGRGAGLSEVTQPRYLSICLSFYMSKMKTLPVDVLTSETIHVPGSAGNYALDNLVDIRSAHSVPDHSPSSRLIRSLTSLRPPARLTFPGLAGPAKSARFVGETGSIDIPGDAILPRANGDVGYSILVNVDGEVGIGDDGVARIRGISSHSCFPMNLTLRKKGHKSANIVNEVCASAGM